MRLTIFALLALLLSISLATAADRLLTVQIVTADAWQADSSADWLPAYATDPASIGAILLVHPEQGLIPTPDASGTFDAGAWAAFTASRLNPVRNAVRLLGPATTVTQIKGKQSWTLTWDRLVLRNGRLAGHRADQLTVSLETDGRFMATWTYRPWSPPVLR